MDAKKGVILIAGMVRKMVARPGPTVDYGLRLGETAIPLNVKIGQQIVMRFTGQIQCVQCHRPIKKTYQQGYCYPCMARFNECGNCVLFPEKCLVEEGQCPDNDWAHAHCHSEQIVYLANTSGLKVGITRVSQMPTRWMDQGAIQAMPIFTTANRYRAGLMEVVLKSHIADKTNWRQMLKCTASMVDMLAAWQELRHQAAHDITALIESSAGRISAIDDGEVHTFQYPIQTIPEKISALSFDRTPDIAGCLQGIKGQYLLFDHGVLNIRKFGGYVIEYSDD